MTKNKNWLFVVHFSFRIHQNGKLTIEMNKTHKAICGDLIKLNVHGLWDVLSEWRKKQTLWHWRQKKRMPNGCRFVQYVFASKKPNFCLLSHIFCNLKSFAEIRTSILYKHLCHSTGLQRNNTRKNKPN